MPPIQIVPFGTPWPFPGYAESALVMISIVELEARISAKLVEGVEVGFGCWKATGLALPSGAIVEPVRYEEASGPKAFNVRTLAGVPPTAVLEELVVCLGLENTSIIWRAGNAAAPPQATAQLLRETAENTTPRVDHEL